MSTHTPSAADPMRVGFLGLGHMGEPMAANLLRARGDLVVWNRTPAAAQRLGARGARVVATPALVFESCDTVILMLANLDAINETLGRTDGSFAVPVRGRVILNMGTIAPVDSAQLSEALRDHGATYLEAPVSGSRVPAENGALVAMLAGPAEAAEPAAALLTAMCRSVFRCGGVPSALTTKLAVNVFLIDMVTGLAEATRFAEGNGVDLEVFRAVLDNGPMGSDVSRLKLAKLLADDYAPQATVRDVRYNSRLILDQAGRSGTELPLLADCEGLLGATEQLGHEDADMVAVVLALRQSVRRGQQAAGAEQADIGSASSTGAGSA
jgi:3-hydroxyisobutyrate dehydrogenase